MADTTYVRTNNADRVDRVDRLTDNSTGWVIPAIIVLVVLALGIWALSRANNGQTIVPTGSVTPNSGQTVTPSGNTTGPAGASQTTGSY